MRESSVRRCYTLCMRWPVLLIGAVILIAVSVFAVSYGSPATPSVSTPLPHIVPSIGLQSGIQGRVQVRCDDGAPEDDCRPQIRVIQAYQGASSVGLFKTRPDGSFRGELPAGQYELRVDTSANTHCASIGVVVQENSFAQADIMCSVSAL